MRRYSGAVSGLRPLTLVLGSALVVSVAIAGCGCATGASSVAASTYAKASAYGSASAYVRLEPQEAFDSAVKLLLEREDIKIIGLTETDSRCTAAAGDRNLTFRVIESSPGRSRLSMMVGGGSDSGGNEAWAAALLQQICGRLSAACDFKTVGP